jgi:hypothetical protein
MSGTRVYEGRQGWFYEVWVASRVVVFGWCRTREGAQRAAEVA